METEPNQRNDEGKKKPKRKAVKAKKQNFSLGKIGDVLSRIGEWSAGVAAIAATCIWFWLHPLWAYWVALIAMPSFVVFAAFRFREYRTLTRIVWVCVALVGSCAVAYWLPPKGDEPHQPWQPPQMAEGTRVAYLLLADGEFRIDLEAVKTNNNESTPH